MQISAVPPEYVHQTWAHIEKYIEDALQYSEGDYSTGDARNYVSSGLWQLIVALDDTGAFRGAAVVSYFNRPRDRVAFVVAIGGRLISNKETFQQLSAILRGNGATCIEGAARDQILRLWAKYGLKPKYTIVSTKI